MSKIKLNETYEFKVRHYAFGDLKKSEVAELLQDGRFMAPLMERQLTKWFPKLKHVLGDKDHDHIVGTQKYDAKNFTRNGLKFMPSAMIGAGRKVDPIKLKEKCAELIYICCDIVEFPNIRVKFIKGDDLLNEYPKGTVSKGRREVLFA